MGSGERHFGPRHGKGTAHDVDMCGEVGDDVNDGMVPKACEPA